jgi:hypothetical protein
MQKNRLISGAMLLTLMLLTSWVGGGCSKSPAVSEEGDVSQNQGDMARPTQPGAGWAGNSPALELHWVGKRKLAGDPDAAGLMKIWGLPQGQNLERQTLDKLAVSFWRGKDTNSAATGAAIATLRGMLEDLVQEEWHIKAHIPTNGSPDLAVAIRLAPSRVKAWQANALLVAEAATGMTPKPSKDGWMLLRSPPETTIECSLMGEWVILVLGGADLPSLKRELQTELDRSNSQPGKEWLQARFSMAALLPLLAGDRIDFEPLAWPHVALAIRGDGDRVISTGELRFAKALELELDRWAVPTNRIKEPVVSFMGIRGVRKIWQPMLTRLNLGVAPNQAFGWSYPVDAVPYETHFAVPWPDASNRIAKVVGPLAESGNVWLATNAMGSLQEQPGRNLMSWVDIPFLTPELKVERIGDADFVLGGFFPNRPARTPEPVGLLEQLFSKTNYIYYAWEITQERVGGWMDIGQLLRIALKRPQLPPNSHSTAFLVAAAPSLGNCVTTASLTDSNCISFRRNSSIGLTGLELHLLADWLESPEFPRGFHTLLATRQAARRAGKNAESPVPAQLQDANR